jgi:polyvinyl alcohol dehydrogenase (cytochrome)
MNSAVRAAIACATLSFAFHSTAPAHVARAQNTATTASDEKQIQAGKKLYASNCVFCHGADGNGTGAGPSLRKLNLPADQIAGVISDGKAGTAMPAFKGTYSTAQIGDLAQYVLSLMKSGASANAQKRSATSNSPEAEGAAIYANKCASCHEVGTAPLFNHYILKSMSPDYILYVLRSGAMREIAAKMPFPQRVAVAEYLTGKRAGSSRPTNPSAGQCTGPASSDFSKPEWNGWGVDMDNSRFQPADQAGLTAAQVPKLKLKWAFGFPGDWGAFAQPVVAGGRVFVGSSMGVVYSLDAKTGCTYWKFRAEGAVRSAVVIGAGNLAYFGDYRTNIYAVNAITGKLVWKTRITDHPYARVTDAPKLYEGRLYAGVSSREEWMASDPHYECCTFRGVLVSLDAATGKQIWRTYTISTAPHPTATKPDGTKKWGPSGAAIWSSPTADAQKGLLYVGVGDNYSDPPTANSDSILAVDMKTGKIVWSKQLTTGDTFNTSCIQRDTVNCPAKPGGDYDFAAPPLLRTLPSGQRMLILSQKSATVLAIDPDKQGAVLWKAQIGKGGPLGGIEWGPAADAKVVYEALSDLDVISFPEGIKGDSKVGGGLFAIDIATGKQIWAAPPVPGTCRVPRCTPAQSAAVTAIPGVVFSGSDDGHMRAYSAENGKIVWDFDTARNFKTVNNVPAHGGSIDGGGGAAIAGGRAFVNSGYGALFGMPGNVLLAFGPQ